MRGEEEEERAAEADRYLCQGRTCAGVVTEERARGPGAMTSWLHQEQGYGGSESRSAEKVEATGFSGRPLQPLTRVLQEAAGSNQLPIFSQPDFSIQSILILTLKHVNCISFSVVT